jgi:hypothetical protein
VITVWGGPPGPRPTSSSASPVALKPGEALCGALISAIISRLSKKHHSDNSHLDEFLEETRAKQQNTVWPGAYTNASRVDAYLWKGSSNPRLVQRLGAWLIGICLYLAGIACICVSVPVRSWLGAVFGAGSVLLGIRIFLNGFPKLQKRNRPRDVQAR